MSTENPNLQSDHPVTGASDGAAAEPRRGAARWAAAVGRSVPTLLVLAALGGIAYWGHHTGWRAPKFSQLAGATPAAQKEDWCEEHGVPDSRCIKCHPELV